MDCSPRNRSSACWRGDDPAQLSPHNLGFRVLQADLRGEGYTSPIKAAIPEPPRSLSVPKLQLWRWASRSDRGRSVRQPKTLQDALDHIRIEDQGDQLAPGLALVAAQDVDSEDTLHELRVAIAVDRTVP